MQILQAQTQDSKEVTDTEVLQPFKNDLLKTLKLAEDYKYIHYHKDSPSC